MVGENIASKLLEINAVQLNPGQPFTWASGWKSPIYCDNRKALSYPMVRNAIKSEICKVIRQFFGGADLLAGVATAALYLRASNAKAARFRQPGGRIF